MVRRDAPALSCGRSARSPARRVEIVHRTLFVGIRLFRHQTSAADDRRADQRHTAGDDARGGHADLRRAAQRVSVGRRGAGHRIALSAEPVEPQGRGRFPSRRLDLLHRRGRRAGGCERVVRQVHHAPARPCLRAELVYLLSVLDDVRGRAADLVAAPEAYDALPLELGHSLHFAFSVGGRSLLSLCVERLRSDDFGRLDDPPWLGRRLVRIRRAALPRTQPARQGDRSGVDPRLWIGSR